MKKTIEIDGKEYEVLGTETKGDSFGIHTNAGTKGGTFWMKPCEPKPGQAAFYMGENGFVKALPPECPQTIRRITFDEPDLTDQFPEEVKADYQAYKKHCEDAGEEMLSLEQYKARVAVYDVWNRHKTPELALQYGYIDSTLYSMNLKGETIEGKKIDPDYLRKFKWAAEYMDEDGRGTFFLFERLTPPDPLPKSLRVNESDARENSKHTPLFPIKNAAGELIFKACDPDFAEIWFSGSKYICPPKGRAIVKLFWQHFKDTGGCSLTQNHVLTSLGAAGETLRDSFKGKIKTWDALFESHKGTRDLYDFLPAVSAANVK